MALSAGLTTDCTKSCAGGVRRIWIANAQDIDTITIDPTGQVSAIVMVATEVFFEVQLKRQSKQFTQNSTVDDSGCTIGIDQSLVGLAQCYDQDIRTFLVELAEGSCCGYVVIIENNDGFVGIFGHLEGLPAQYGGDTSTDTGTTIQDPNQVTINITCNTTAQGWLAEFIPGVAGIPV